MHAADLRANLAGIARLVPEIEAQQRHAGWEDGLGLRVVFSSFPQVQLAIDSFDLKSAGIELLNVREAEGVTIATVWVPHGQLELFEQKIVGYLAAPGTAVTVRDSRTLLDAIRQIRVAAIEDLWTDQSPIPADDRAATFEAWLSTPVVPDRDRRTRRNRLRLSPEERIGRFRDVAEAAGLRVSRRALRFPERAVLQVRGTIAQFKDSANLLGQLAELRLAPEPAEFFMRLDPEEQVEWVDELIGRTEFADPEGDVPYVCVLDTGCTHGHPLLAASIAPDDVHSVHPAWGGGDSNGHGTAQSGLTLWGDLTDALSGQARINVGHRIESVKLLPDQGANNEDHFGPLTAEAVSRPEIHAPHRRRLFSMAVTSDTHVMTGRPTAWSSEVDALTSDWSGGGEARRLVIVSGGNVSGLRPGRYFATNSGTPIEDPAHAWNALTVGAMTRKVQITEEFADAYSPVAESGELSPYSSTSSTWNREAPFKPEVVFEGGNMGDDGQLCSQFDSLSLLTTNYRPLERQFATTWATSAATALASRFGAQIMAKYPSLWPETVRAMFVDSAEWTPELLRQFPNGTRDAVERRLRHCGWGEPDLASALNSGADSLTLIAQSELQPYVRQPRRGITACDLQLHRLPWPREALQDLDVSVELRISLSYFVEPNPGERGRSDRFRYASHGLRFAVQQPLETADQFQRRINRLAREDDGELEYFEREDPNWLLGPRKRFRGSLHHDRIVCSAPELASREHIAVFPVGGWWKNREALERFDRMARYSLVVSIRAPEVPNDVDLYAGVQQAIQLAVQVPIPVPI